MKLVIFGAPGSGKGTQAERLSKKYNIPHISTGEIFRALKRGRQVPGMTLSQDVVDRVSTLINGGSFVPDELAIDVLKNRISLPDCENGFILDGFPRNLEQAKVLDEMMDKEGHKIDVALELYVEDDVIVKRLVGRRSCTDCGNTYHIEAKMPTEADKAACRTHCINLIQRDDDKEEIIRKRLVTYHEVTEKLKPYYESQGKLVTAYGKGKIEDTNAEVDAVMSKIN
jgi:adenylate kinase